PSDAVVPTGPAGSQTPGKVDGTLDVTSDGALTYTVPLELPPGRAQLAPNLGLTYNSRQGLGPYGTAWNHAGTSEISRCKKTIAQNGNVGAIHYDDTDAFCLDGVQLISSGTDAQGRKQYRTENDLFAQITVTASDSEGPVSFEVRTRDGRIHTYG